MYAIRSYYVEADDVYNQADAEGFIKLNALRMRIAAIQRANKK